LLVEKPSGVSSFSVISAARKKLNIKKIGHAGTLDRFASGLLFLGINGGTKAISEIILSKKTYQTKIVFGISSDTLDPTGKIEKFLPPKISEQKIMITVKSFQGKIWQTPPKFSAIKIDGKRASDRIRAGEKISLTPKKVEIFSIKLKKISNSSILFPGFPEIEVELEVSSGFFVRSFARDLGKKMGFAGICSELIRKKINHFSISNAVKINEINRKKIKKFSPQNFSIPSFEITKNNLDNFFHGKPFNLNQKNYQKIAVFFEKQWIGFAEIKNKIVFPKKVISDFNRQKISVINKETN